MIKNKISVVICTYNRAEILKKCLEYLKKQTIEKAYYEVFIIDNNSADYTKEESEYLIKQNSIFYYYFEKVQELSFARNRGWKEAKGDFMAGNLAEKKLIQLTLKIA